MKKAKTLLISGRVVTALKYLGVSVILITAIVLLGDEIVLHINAFEAWIESLGVWAAVSFILISVVLNSVFFPQAVICIIAGAAFGFSGGLIVAICGSLVSAILQYGLSRHLLKPAIDRVLVTRPALVAIQTAVLQQGLRLQLLIRLTPLNTSLISYVLGAAGVEFTRFLAACIAILPNLSLEVYFGYAGKHLTNVGQPVHTAFLHNIALLIGLILAITVMILISLTARRAVDAATASISLNSK